MKWIETSSHLIALDSIVSISKPFVEPFCDGEFEGKYGFVIKTIDNNTFYFVDDSFNGIESMFAVLRKRLEGLK